MMREDCTLLLADRPLGVALHGLMIHEATAFGSNVLNAKRNNFPPPTLWNLYPTGNSTGQEGARGRIIQEMTVADSHLFVP